MVLDQVVRMQDVRPNLISPTGLDVVALETGSLGLALLFFDLGQASGKDLQRRLFVLSLRSLVLTRNDDTGRQVGDPDRRARFLDVLTAGAGRAKDVDLDFIRVD